MWILYDTLIYYDVPHLFLYRRSSWTTQVAAHVADVSNTSAQKGCPFSMGIIAEGPYGHESEYYLNYKTLVLIAGGIGITPLMAIIRDILHRYRIKATNANEEQLPKNIVLIWAVRSESELDILRQVSPSLISSNYKSCDFRIRVRVFVTQIQNNITDVDDTANQVNPIPSIMQFFFFFFLSIEVPNNSTQDLIKSWLFCIPYYPCLVSFCVGPKLMWRFE